MRASRNSRLSTWLIVPVAPLCFTKLLGRPEGLGYREAAERIFALACAARHRRLTGVALKEDRVPLFITQSNHRLD